MIKIRQKDGRQQPINVVRLVTSGRLGVARFKRIALPHNVPRAISIRVFTRRELLHGPCSLWRQLVFFSLHVGSGQKYLQPGGTRKAECEHCCCRLCDQFQQLML